MPETTARGIRYPLGNESPDWPGDFDRLASDIDALVPRVALGNTRISPKPNEYTRKRVPFPAGLFDAPPNMIASAETGVPGRIVKGAAVGTTGDIDKNGGDLILYRTNSTTTTVGWAAWQNTGGVSAKGWLQPKFDGVDNTLARPSRFLNSLQAAVLAGLIRVDAGVETLTTADETSNGDREKNISFARGRFTAPPTVVTCMNTTVPGGTYTGCGHAHVSPTGATLYLNRTNTTNSSIMWVAIQLTATGKLWTPGGSADLPGIFAEFADNAEKRIPRIDSGYANITPTANQPTALRIEFEPGRFTKPPVVIATAGSAAIGSTLKGVGVSSITATGVDVYVNRTNTTLTGVRYLAVQVD